MFRRILMCLLAPIALLACADARDQQTAHDTTPVGREAAAPVFESAGMLDPNTATIEQLGSVPDLDAARVHALVQGRPYADMLAVDAVLPGLTDEQRDSVYTRVWKRIDLNTATPAEMELIPGVGPRMRHEFEEYRPWTSIEQFRREIGKYVDDEEVARLERYVIVNAPATSP